MTRPSILSETARTLKPGEFRGHCARGHDRLDFTDREAWVEHHKSVHGRRQHTPGGREPFQKDNLPASPWGTGPATPRPWKAPTGKAPDLRAWVNSGDLEVDGVELPVPPETAPSDRITRGPVLLTVGGKTHLVPARRCGEWALHMSPGMKSTPRISHAPTGKLAWVAGWPVKKITDLDTLLLALGPVVWDDTPEKAERVRRLINDWQLL